MVVVRRDVAGLPHLARGRAAPDCRARERGTALPPAPGLGGRRRHARNARAVREREPHVARGAQEEGGGGVSEVAATYVTRHFLFRVVLASCSKKCF